MDELAEEFERAASVGPFAHLALNELLARMPQPYKENPDPAIFVGPDEPGPEARVDGVWKRSVLESAADKSGWLNEWISDAFILLTFARWEDHYRPAFAAAHGVSVGEVRCTVMGELRHLRNDIAHSGGIAQARHAGKCTIVRFSPGTRIILTPDDIRRLRSRLLVDTAPVVPGAAFGLKQSLVLPETA